MEKLVELNIHADGGARGNPGPAAIGVEIKTAAGQLMGQISQYVGETTNNEAEYLAVAAALKFISENKITASKINLFIDSQLIFYQLRGEYKIKNHKLKELFTQIKTLETKLNCPVIYYLIPRNQNQEADWLVNRALDKRLIT